MELDRAIRRAPSSRFAHRAELTIPKRTSLPSMLPARLQRRSSRVIDGPASRNTAAVLFRDHADDEQADEDHGHGRQHRPPLARVRPP